MAALIGYLYYGHHAGTVHRLAHQDIASELATWKGKVYVTLDRYGQANVQVNGKIVWEGNVGGEEKEKKEPRVRFKGEEEVV